MQHRAAPTLQRHSTQHRQPPTFSAPLVREAERIEALIQARLAARAEFSSYARALAAKSAKASAARAKLRPASAPLKGAAAAPRAKIAAARDAAATLKGFLAGPQQRTPWRFFACRTVEGVGQAELHVSAPAVLDERSLPDVIVARPACAEERKLAFGPFAFRLSPSSETLAWLCAQSAALRAQLDGAHVLELGSGLVRTRGPNPPVPHANVR